MVNKILWLIPTGHSFRLIANAFAGRTLYPYQWLSLGDARGVGGGRLRDPVVAAGAAGRRVTMP